MGKTGVRVNPMDGCRDQGVGTSTRITLRAAQLDLVSWQFQSDEGRVLGNVENGSCDGRRSGGRATHGWECSEAGHTAEKLGCTTLLDRLTRPRSLPGTPVSFTSETDMILDVAQALSPNKPNLEVTLAVTEALSPNKPNLDMTLAVAEALSPNKPNLDMTLAVAEALSPNKPNLDMTLAVAEAPLTNQTKP